MRCRCSSGPRAYAFVTATDKASAAQLASGAALEHHLAEHDITAVFETVAIDGSSVGKVFEQYVEDNAIDLLVMGGFAIPGSTSISGAG